MARKRIFLPTPFSHSTLKLKLKNFTPQNQLLFLLYFLFQRDRNHYSNWPSGKSGKSVNRLKTIAERIPETTRSAVSVKELHFKSTGSY